jgi:hypothetical protein
MTGRVFIVGPPSLAEFLGEVSGARLAVAHGVMSAHKPFGRDSGIPLSEAQ